MFNNDSRTAQALVIGISLILCSIIGGLFYHYSRFSDNVLSVTGSAKTEVTSDLGKITIAVERTTVQSQLGSGYSGLMNNANLVKDFLIKQGADSSKIVITPVSTQQHYDNDNQFVTDPRYDLRQTIEYQSQNVSQITALSQSVTGLSNQGIIVSIDSVEYFYSKLADLRISLLGNAVKDAEARAKEIAQSSGREISSIQSASSGVVQVLPVSSIDVSDSGTYDTSHVQKEVMVTVKASFGVK